MLIYLEFVKCVIIGRVCVCVWFTVCPSNCFQCTVVTSTGNTACSAGSCNTNYGLTTFASTCSRKSNTKLNCCEQSYGSYIRIGGWDSYIGVGGWDSYIGVVERGSYIGVEMRDKWGRETRSCGMS